MAVIRIKNSTTAGSFPSGLTKGELAVNLTDKTLWVGASFDTDPAVYLSGVQTFNGLTGAVTGVTVGGANVFTQLNTFSAGLSASGATLGRLTVNNGISAAGGITFNSLSHFTQGLSGSGATLGTLVVNSGISASGGVTFHNNTYVGGILTVVEGMEASGGVTFANTLYVGETLSVQGDLEYGGVLLRNGQTVNIISTYGTTSDLPRPGMPSEVAVVTGTSEDDSYGLYLWDDGISFEYNNVRGAWIRISDATGYRWSPDYNGDGIIDGADLANLLAAWGEYTQYVSGGEGSSTLQIGLGDNLSNAFEVKVYGISTGKKASAFKITSDDAEPYVYFQATETNFNSRVIISDSSGQPALLVQTGKSVFNDPVEFGLGFSAGCGVTFNCLTHHLQGLSASGATLGTLVVNGGATFNGPVYMGATLTMNSNIRFNSGYGINAGFVDAGWY